MIYYLTAYSTQKDFGGAINNLIEPLPDDSIICLRDGDMMFLQPDFGHVVAMLSRKLDAFDLIGCMTNRVGVEDQLLDGFSNDFNIRTHIEKAKNQFERYKDTVMETDLVAGFFLLFKKEIWQRVGGFVEKSFSFDARFSKAVKKAGGNIGLAKGLYVFHQYRPAFVSREKAQSNGTHLV